MSHGDHNHYFFKKDLTAEQIKSAQDHLRGKTPVTPSPAHDDHDEDTQVITMTNMAMISMSIELSVKMRQALS